MIYPIHVIVYIVIGTILGLLFTTFMLNNKAMDDRVVSLGLITVFWLPMLALTSIVGALWLLVKCGDYTVKIARLLW